MSKYNTELTLSSNYRKAGSSSDGSSDNNCNSKVTVVVVTVLVIVIAVNVARRYYARTCGTVFWMRKQKCRH